MPPTQFTPPAEMATDHFRTLLDQCIHCGLCLQNCPTYVVEGKEMDAPRGRIQLMRAVSDGRIPLEGTFRDHLDSCLSCLSCQSACPSGVQYSRLIETTHLTLAKNHKPGFVERVVQWVGLRQGMPHLNRLRFVARLLRIYQITGMQKAVRAMNILPSKLDAMERILPPLPASYIDYSKSAPAQGEKRGTVMFFYGCLQDAFITNVNAATIRVLQRNGYEVRFPQSQTCCGAAQLHVGDKSLAQDLARRNIDAFQMNEVDAIINNAGGCGAVLKEYDTLLADDPVYAEKAKTFVSKVQDVSEFLVRHLNRPPQGKLNTRVTYADSCHLRNAQKVVAQPRQLIRSIPGVQLVELASPDRCCGSAGVYNIVHPQMADEILDSKMADVAATKTDTLVTTNTGCHMQYVYGVRRAKLNMRVMHLVELLDESYRAEKI